MSLAYADLTAELLRRFPALIPEYEEERKWAGDSLDGPHVSYGDLLNPYVISLLESGGDGAVLRRAFDFIEELATDPDVRVRNVAAVTVVERLTDKEDWLTAAWPYMGPSTRRLAKEMAAFWGTSPSFPFR